MDHIQPDELTLSDVVDALQLPAEQWEGRCYYIACKTAELVGGKAVYGSWLGPVHPKSFWREKKNAPFIRHGWVVLPDGRLLDPTRWSFENKKPYLWIGPRDSEEYDQGNNKFAETLLPLRRWPANTGGRQYHFQFLVETTQILEEHGAELLPIDHDPWDLTPIEAHLSAEQVCWVANFPPTLYKSDQHAHEVYEQVEKYGLRSFIPIDNYRMIME